MKTEINQEDEIKDLCEEEHCHCNESGIIKSALKHTINIFFFYNISNIYNKHSSTFCRRRKYIKNINGQKPIIGPIISALIGLIPNCAASVIPTNMYLQKVISASSLIAGLLTGAGVGLAVLFKTNKGIKNNIKIK